MTDVQYIESVFKSVFSFDRNVKLCITFQRFDADWNEFVDLEIGDEINHKDKLKAIVSPLLSNIENSSVSAITPSPASPSPCYSDINAVLSQVLDSDDDLPPVPPSKRSGKRHSIVIQSDSNDSGDEEMKSDSMGPYKRIKSENDCAGTCMSSGLFCNDKLSVSSEGSIGKLRKLDKDKDVILPNPFPFPKNFIPAVEVAIRTGEVGKTARNGFLSGVLHAVYSRKRYPSERDFCNISTQIMEQFPNFYSSQV